MTPHRHHEAIKALLFIFLPVWVVEMVLCMYAFNWSVDNNAGVLVDFCIWGWMIGLGGIISCLETAKDIRRVKHENN